MTTDLPEVSAASLPHQVEESDRLSLIGLVRIVGFVTILCGIVQVSCGTFPYRFEEAAWVLATSPKWNGPACLFFLGGLLFFIPGPLPVRYGTPGLRMMVRLLFGVLGIGYLVLAFTLGDATAERLKQLHQQDLDSRAERETAFRGLIKQVQTVATRQNLDELFAKGGFPPLPSPPSPNLDEYRNQVIAHLTRENEATIASYKTEVVDEIIEANKITFIRKIIRSTTFGLGLILMAWFAPKGFPLPVNPHEQST